MSEANEKFFILPLNIITWIQGKNCHSKFNPCNKSHQKDWDKRYVWFVVLFFSENRSSHFRWTYRSPMLSDTNNFCKILIILMLMNDWIVKSRSACKIGPPFYKSEWSDPSDQVPLGPNRRFSGTKNNREPLRAAHWRSLFRIYHVQDIRSYSLQTF